MRDGRPNPTQRWRTRLGERFKLPHAAGSQRFVRRAQLHVMARVQGETLAAGSSEGPRTLQRRRNLGVLRQARQIVGPSPWQERAGHPAHCPREGACKSDAHHSRALCGG